MAAFSSASLHSIPTNPLPTLQISWRNPQSRLICDTLKFHLRGAAGTQKKNPQSTGEKSQWGRKARDGRVGKTFLGNGKLNLERVFWTPCTGVISAADNKLIHFVMVRKMKFIFPKKLSWQMLQLYLKCQSGITVSK